MTERRTSGHHPTDSYSRLSAHTTNYQNLIDCFEQAIKVSEWDVELIAAVAIARVELLERSLGIESRGGLFSRTTCTPDNVVSIDWKKKNEDQPA